MDWGVKLVFLVVGGGMAALGWWRGEAAVEANEAERERTAAALRASGYHGPVCGVCGRRADSRVTETRTRGGRRTGSRTWTACPRHTETKPRSYPMWCGALMVLGGLICLGIFAPPPRT